MCDGIECRTGPFGHCLATCRIPATDFSPIVRIVPFAGLLQLTELKRSGKANRPKTRPARFFRLTAWLPGSLTTVQRRRPRRGAAACSHQTSLMAELAMLRLCRLFRCRPRLERSPSVSPLAKTRLLRPRATRKVTGKIKEASVAKKSFTPHPRRQDRAKRSLVNKENQVHGPAGAATATTVLQDPCMSEGYQVQVVPAGRRETPPRKSNCRCGRARTARKKEREEGSVSGHTHLFPLGSPDTGRGPKPACHCLALLGISKGLKALKGRSCLPRVCLGKACHPPGNTWQGKAIKGLKGLIISWGLGFSARSACPAVPRRESSAKGGHLMTTLKLVGLGRLVVLLETFVLYCIATSRPHPPPRP